MAAGPDHDQRGRLSRGTVTPPRWPRRTPAPLTRARIGDLDVPEAYLRRMIINELSSARRRVRARIRREQIHRLEPVSDRTEQIAEHDALVQLRPATRIQATLDRRVRRHRQRRLVLRVAGVGAAGAAAGLAGVRLPYLLRGGPRFPHVVGGPGADGWRHRCEPARFGCPPPTGKLRSARSSRATPQPS